MGADDLTGRRLGGFDLIEPLGAGSYGSVWRARQVRLDRDVAVKVLDPLVARDPNAARRFEREGRAAASLDHPAVVPVYEAGDEDGLYFLAMRLVDGETLADFIEREAPISASEVVALLSPICGGLDAAHGIGLIHRDVKPANILLEGRRAYLTDFGIAASARELGRYTTGSIGTAEYMSPEQARGDVVDHRSDLYALGCVAYHVLTGESPFRRDDMVATLMAHSSDSAPSTGDQRLDAFFDRALAKDAEQRFASAAELISALDDDVETTVRRPTQPARPRSSPRGRLVAAGLVAALGVGVIALALSGGDDASDAVGVDASVTTLDPEEAGDENDDIATEDDSSTEGGTGTDDIAEVPEPDAIAADPTPSEPGGGDVEAPDIELAVREGGIVQVGTTLDLSDPNPHSSLDTARVVAEWVLPVMYRINADLDPVPSLATGPPVVDPDDPLTLTWTIHDDQVWNDGTPVTATDVAATFEYLSAPGSNAQSTLLYESVEAVDVVDSTTLTVRLNEPNGAAYLMFSTVHPIIQAAAWTTHQADGGSATDFLDDGWSFAAGPFQLATRQNPGEVSLVPNREWVGETRPTLERVQIASYENSAALVRARSRGELDVIWVREVGEDDVSDAEALDGTDVQLGSSNIAVQLSFNHQTPALADPRVRAAISSTIDRVGLADLAVGRKTGQVAATWDSLVFAPSQRGHEAPFASDVDVEGANVLLDETPWERPNADVFRRDFSTGEDLALELVYVDTTEFTNAAFDIQLDLQDIGVNVERSPGTADQVSARFESGDFDLLLQFRVFNNDPVATDLVFGTGGCPVGVPNCVGEGVNFGAFSDSVVDSLLAEADLASDLVERLSIYTQIDQALAERAAALPLYVRPAFTAYDSDIVGVSMAPNIGPLTSLASWGLLDD